MAITSERSIYIGFHVTQAVLDQLNKVRSTFVTALGRHVSRSWVASECLALGLATFPSTYRPETCPYKAWVAKEKRRCQCRICQKGA